MSPRGVEKKSGDAYQKKNFSKLFSAVKPKDTDAEREPELRGNEQGRGSRIGQKESVLERIMYEEGEPPLTEER